jgi:hypothetical protein
MIMMMMMMMVIIIIIIIMGDTEGHYTLRRQDASFLLSRRQRQNIHPKLCTHLEIIYEQNFPEEGSSRLRSLIARSAR